MKKQKNNKIHSNKLKLVVSFLFMSIGSALLFGGLLVFITYISIMCALSLGCSGSQSVSISVGVVLYIVVLFFIGRIIYKVQKLPGILITFALLAGIPLLFAGVKGYYWVEGQQAKKKYQAEQVKLLADHEKVSIGELQLQVNRDTETNEVTIMIAAPIHVTEKIPQSSVEKLFVLSKFPDKFTDKEGNFCGSFDSKLHLYWNKDSSGLSGLVFSSDENNWYVTPKNSSDYLLGHEVTLFHCSKPELPKNFSSDSFSVTKVPLDELKP